MSNLVAIDPECIKKWEDFRYLSAFIGQTKTFFLSQLPPSFCQDLQSNPNLEQNDKLKILARLEFLKKQNALYRINANNFEKNNFLKSIMSVIEKEKRLSLVVSESSRSQIIKSLDDLDGIDLGPKAFSGRFTPNEVWNYIEFYARSSERLAIVSRYNNLTTSSGKPSRFYLHLEKIFGGIADSRCYEILIYTRFNRELVEHQDTSIIKNLLTKALGRNKPPQYGIHYFICEDINANHQITTQHARHIVTNFTVLNLDDDLGGNAATQGIQVSTDENINKKKRELWLEQKHGLPIINEIHITR
jgi:hypothetical protein